MLQVDYAQIQGIAAQIHQEAENYMSDVNSLYQIVDSLTDVWEGNDNASYTTSVYSYQEDIKKLGQVVNNYAIFLDGAAGSLSSVQDDISSAASRL